jgi:hypothetical protein
MPCCKIGCEYEPVQSQEIAFRNQAGYIVRGKIEWCEKHAPECILEDFAQVDILRDRGGSY